jgi:hypothetical protein
MDKHRDFIFSPISGILKEVVAANSGIGDGIETYPLSEYIFQSAFLKMTGFQEQKLKCIVWDLATNDYVYRYKRFTSSPFGECSAYREKKEIYKDLVDLITDLQPGFKVYRDVDKSTMETETVTEMKTIFGGSNLSTWAHDSYMDFENDPEVIPAADFITQENFLEPNLHEKYELLYRHRNRCAHNTLSYQENLPTLSTLRKNNPKDDNYFVRFTLLILLDKIYVTLYKKHQQLLEDN